MFHRSLRDKIFPINSNRRLFAKIIYKAIKNPGLTLKSLNKTVIKKIIYYLRNVEPGILEEKLDKQVWTHSIMLHCDNAFVSDIIEVSGWAISFTVIDRVEIYFDNILLGNASYGRLRSDLHALYPFIKNSLNSGFYFFSVLNKVKHSADNHTLSIKAITKDGRTAELVRSFNEMDFYQKYLTKITPSMATLGWMKEISEGFLYKPDISLALIVTEETLPFLARSIDSLIDQSYPYWDVTLFYEKEVPQDTIRKLQPLVSENKLRIYSLKELDKLHQVKGDFLGFISSGDVLMPNALFEIVKRINIDRGMDVIYADEDTLIDGTRKEYFFKPDWSPDLLLSMNYIGRFFLFRRELFPIIGGLHNGFSPEGMYDLLLRLTEHTEDIGHVPLVLFTKGRKERYSPETGEMVLEEALMRRGIKAEVIPLNSHGTYRVKRQIIGNPRVSIIIPTAYKNPNLFNACLQSIVEKSTYSNYQIIFIDNSHGRLPFQELKQIIPQSVSLYLIRYEEQFNFSRMNNQAAMKADGDYLLFLNDDTEVIAPEWIEAMLEHAQRPEVGIVGAKLLYGDNSIQHGGIFFTDSGGGARHAFRFSPNNTNGYWGLSGVIRNCSAVTFACVMIPKKVFLELGGLNENLTIECNDTDFCLRAIREGYRIVWTPFALLYHKELTTRGPHNVN